MKPQTIRLYDVLVIGPVMIWGGWKLLDEQPFLGSFLLASGMGTIVYNGRNYLKVERGELIAGGDAAGRSPSSFDPEQLRIGTRVEMEHTVDSAIAREIAMDHLTEDPLYYLKLLRAGL
jgi:hypothetical protein